MAPSHAEEQAGSQSADRARLLLGGSGLSGWLLEGLPEWKDFDPPDNELG